jgi:hypothetical protein
MRAAPLERECFLSMRDSLMSQTRSRELARRIKPQNLATQVSPYFHFCNCLRNRNFGFQKVRANYKGMKHRALAQKQAVVVGAEAFDADLLG